MTYVYIYKNSPTWYILYFSLMQFESKGENEKKNTQHERDMNTWQCQK